MSDPPIEEYRAARAGTLLLRRSDIGRLVPPLAYLAPIRDAFRRLAASEVTAAPVVHLAGVEGGFHIKTAATAISPRRAVVKVNGNFPDNPVRQRLPAIQGFVALLDGACGSVLALMDSAEITAQRTAATSAVAAQLLAHPRSRRLALIGCGVQARYHFSVLAEVFSLETVALYDPSPAQVSEVERLIRARQISAEIRPSAPAAARDADIVVTTTPSRTALLGLDDVAAGCFIAAVGADSEGKQELAPALLRRAKVVPDVLSQACHMGDLQHALAAGSMRNQDIHGELADVVSGRVAGRRDDDELFVFDSTGVAVTDLAAAAAVYDLACADSSLPRIRLDG